MPKERKEAGIGWQAAYEILLANYMDETLRSRFNSAAVAKATIESKNLLQY